MAVVAMLALPTNHRATFESLLGIYDSNIPTLMVTLPT